MNYKEIWNELKEWIKSTCFYDFDTINYIDISEEMDALESKIKDDSEEVDSNE